MFGELALSISYQFITFLNLVIYYTTLPNFDPGAACHQTGGHLHGKDTRIAADFKLTCHDILQCCKCGIKSISPTPTHP